MTLMSCLESSSPVKDHKIIHPYFTGDFITFKSLIHLEFVISIKCLQLFFHDFCLDDFGSLVIHVGGNLNQLKTDNKIQ